MKKALLSVVAVVILAFIGWLAFLGYATRQEHRAADVGWPSSLGLLDEVPKRFPDAEQSAGATKLVQLASAAHLELRPRERMGSVATPKPGDVNVIARKAIGEYVKTQFERSGDAIDAPPPPAAQYLAENEAALNAVRDHLLSGAPIVWETKLSRGFNAPIPNLSGLINLQKVLAARALDKARRNDAAAWDELHASWELNRGVWHRPDLISILIAIASTRMSNAAARKMPLPAPDWLRETYTFDYVGAMAASQQAEAWMIHHAKPGRLTVKDVLRLPSYRLQGAEYLDVMRKYTTEAVRSRACDSISPQFDPARRSLVTMHLAIPNLISAWHRLIRFRAELEATERVLQLRAGQTPSAKSQCSDGTWQVTSNGIKFSRDVKVPPPGIRYPLEYAR